MTHSSPTLTDEVGVRGLDGEIIHSLRLLNQPQSFHHAIAAIPPPHPATIGVQEGMLRVVSMTSPLRVRYTERI